MSSSIPAEYNIPSNTSMENNILQAQQYAATHSITESYVWFFNQMRNGGPWDYKQQGGQYESFGNFNYGATGTAMGIPESILRRMAGLAQQLAGTSTSAWGSPFGAPPYGDDPADQVWIGDGIGWSEGSGYVRSMIIPPEPLALPGTWELEGLPMLDEINTLYDLSRTPEPPRVDPLVLDLDGDGIETVGIQPGAAVLFDHNADGIKTGSGWVKADDGILVLDLDGNGQIETGRELFGDQTLVQSADQLAANGFAALAQYDTHTDARIDSADAIYSQLQVWQDLNQDGISQSGELHTLSQLGIASINASGTPSGTALHDANTGRASGNTLQASASFTRVDGSVAARWGCAMRVRRKLRIKNGISPRQISIVCYRTESKRRNKN